MQAKRTLKPKRILYVEDDGDTSEMVSYILAGAKYEVTASNSYNQALRTAKNRRFGLYIIDHTLPDGQGFDLCKEIRKFDPKTPIIFCSGYTDDEHQKTALQCGAQAFLAKPFDSGDLLAIVSRISFR